MAASGRLRTLATIATALSFIGMARDATATDFTWSGTSALWSSANWTSGGAFTTFPSGSSSANTGSINSGTVTFGVSDTFGNADTTTSPVIRVGSGATLASGGGFTTIYNLELNGGTLFSNGGLGVSVGTFQLGGTLAVGGGTASTISTGTGSNNVINVGAAANSVLTMNVADVTNTSAADLTIGTILQNYYQVGVKVGSLTKAGPGTAVLTAANTYTGTTRINAGTLQVGGGGTTGSLASTTAITGSAGGTIAFNRTDSYGGAIANTIGGAVNLAVNGGALTLTSNNTYSGTTTIASGTLGIGGGGTTGSLGTGPVVNNGSLVFDRYTNNWTVAAPISGTGTVTKRGGAAMTLTGSNSFQGDFVQWSGVTVLSNTSGPALYADGSPGRIVISNELGGTYAYGAVAMGAANQLGSNVDVVVQPRNIANSYSYLVLQGHDTTIGNLSSTQAYASSWAIVENQESSSFGNSRLTVTQTVDGTFTGEVRNGQGTSVGTLGLTKDGPATLTLAYGGNTGISYTGSTSVIAGTLRLTGSAASPTFAIASGAVLDLATGTSSLIYETRTYVGGGTLRKTGSGLLAWSGSTAISLDATGTVDVQEGTLQASVYANQIWTNNQSTLNVGSGAVFAVDAAAARFSGLTGSGTVRLGLSGSFPLQKLTVGVADASSTFGGVIANGSGTAPFEKIGTGTLTFTGANTYAGTTTISAGALRVGAGGATGTLGSGPVVDNASLIFNRSNSLTVANVISGSGSVTQVGAGTTTLTAASSYTGGTTITAGILATSAADRLLTSGALTVNAPGTFQMGGNQTLASIAGTGAITLGSSTLTTGSSSSTFAGGISGNGGLAKVGPGTLTLTGSSSFLGDTAVRAGTLELSSSNALAGDAVVTMQAGSFLTVNQRTFIGALDQGGGTVNGPGTLVSTLTLTNSGSLNAVLADGPDFAAGILKRTSGTTTVGAANTFTGAVKVQGGTLQLAAGGSFDAGSSLVMSPGATMDVNGHSQTFSAVNGTGGTIALGAGTLTVNNAVDNEFDGAITGSGGLVKQGAGRFLLTGVNTFTGTTSVAAGNLAVNGSLASVRVNVAAAAMLSGTGSLGGRVTIAGLHSPGNSPGVQTIVGDLAYTGTDAGIVWELIGNTVSSGDRGTEYDGVDVGGSLTFNGAVGLNLVFDSAGSQVDWNDSLWSVDHLLTDGWLLYNVGSTLSNWNTDLSINPSNWYDSLGNRLADVHPGASFSVQESGGDLYLAFTAVPEPATLGMAAIGTGLAALALRRRPARRS